MKTKRIPLFLILLSVFQIVLSQNEQDSSSYISFSLGYPCINHSVERIALEKSYDLFLFDVGYKKTIFRKNGGYSVGLLSYNTFYRTSKNAGVYGGPMGKYIQARVKPRLCLWWNLLSSTKHRIITNVGITAFFEFDTYLESLPSFGQHQRIFFTAWDKGLHTSFRYYYQWNSNNCLGLFIEGDYFDGYKIFNMGIGVSYLYKIKN